MGKDLLPLVIIIGGFLAMVLVQRGWTSLYNYRCESCGAVFSVPPLVAATAPRRMGQKLLRCPACGARTWATPVAKN